MISLLAAVLLVLEPERRPIVLVVLLLPPPQSGKTLLLISTACDQHSIKADCQVRIMSSVRFRLCAEKDVNPWLTGIMVYGAET